MGQNKHRSGLKGFMAATGESIDSFMGMDAEVDIGPDERLIVAVMDEVVVVVSGIRLGRLD